MRPALIVFLAACLCVAALACGGGDDATPTPVASPSPTAPAGCFEAQDGVFLCAKPTPLLPPGARALSGYFELVSFDDTALVVGLPLSEQQTDTSLSNIGYYTYSDSGWKGIIGAITLAQDGKVLEGQFPSVPENMAVLYWPDAPDKPFNHTPTATPQ